MGDDLKLFWKHVLKSSYKDLGVNRFDIRAEINCLRIVHQCIVQYGPIILDSIDLWTDFNQVYERKKSLGGKQYKDLIIVYRNQALKDAIFSRKDN